MSRDATLAVLMRPFAVAWRWQRIAMGFGSVAP